MYQLSPEVGTNILRTLFIFGIALIGNLVLHAVISRTIHKIVNLQTPRAQKISPRIKTLKGIIKNTASVIIWIIAGISVLSEWGIDITPIITGAGILGLAIGFGSQTLVKDIVTGFFLLLENQFNVGDEVELGGVKGIVKQINLRTIVMKDLDGTIYYIPNSEVKKVSRYKEGTLERLRKEEKSPERQARKHK